MGMSMTLTLLRRSCRGNIQEVDFPSAKILLGIYSRRIAEQDELAAQIGIVWGAECISEIIASQRAYVLADV